MRTSVLNTVLAVAAAVGFASCVGPDSPTETNTDHFALTARGANVIPPAADTLASITARIVGTAGPIITYSDVVLPSGATQIDSIFLYTLGASAANYTIGNTGATTYVAPSARVCGSSIGTTTTGLAASLPPACAADVPITARPTAVTNAAGVTTTNTDASLTTSMRAFGQQLVVFTSGAFYKRGKIRGTPYFEPSE